MFEFIFECWRNILSTCSWKIASSDDVAKKISQLHQEVADILKIVHESGTTVLDGIEPV